MEPHILKYYTAIKGHAYKKLLITWKNTYVIMPSRKNQDINCIYGMN